MILIPQEPYYFNFFLPEKGARSAELTNSAFVSGFLCCLLNSVDDLQRK